MKKSFGLIGNPLGHSFSPQIHSLLGDYAYNLFPMEENEVAPFLEKRAFDGINVTIPYKQTVIPFCDRISDEARRIGSVNTVVKEADGSLSGYNTDHFGFTLMLKRAGIDPKGKKALVLGSGGSSKTAVCALNDLGASEVIVISRSGENNYQNLHLHSDAFLIVNTTPVGMYPKNGISPIDLSIFPKCEAVADLIYNPEKTALILEAEKHGIRCAGGLYMLVAQGAKASEFFTGNTYTEEDMERVYRGVNCGMRNVILVGMPGSGKSTVGKEVAKLLGRELADSDDFVTKTTGISPAEWINTKGESEFRRVESEALSELSKRSGLVIATGGGAVTVPENHALLRQNGRVFFINRKISLLARDGRPLSVGDLSGMYEKRLPLYRSVCDFEITTDESSDVKETAKKIVEIFRN